MYTSDVLVSCFAIFGYKEDLYSHLQKGMTKLHFSWTICHHQKQVEENRSQTKWPSELVWAYSITACSHSLNYCVVCKCCNCCLCLFSWTMQRTPQRREECSKLRRKTQKNYGKNTRWAGPILISVDSTRAAVVHLKWKETGDQVL